VVKLRPFIEKERGGDRKATNPAVKAEPVKTRKPALLPER